MHKGVGLGQQWCKIKFILLLNVWGIQSLSQYVSDYRIILKGLVSGSCIAGFCYCLHFTQIQQIAIKIPCLVHF